MKLTQYFFCAVVIGVMGISTCPVIFCCQDTQDYSENRIDDESAYELLLVLLDKGYLVVQHCPLVQTRSCLCQSDTNSICTIDLSDNSALYNHLACTNQMNGLIVIRSSNQAVSDYFINWGAMVGVDLRELSTPVHMPALITTDDKGNKRVALLGVLENRPFNLEIPLAPTVDDVCVLVVPATLVQKMKICTEVMSLSEACRLGIIAVQEHDACICDQAEQREIEFDRIIESMLADGTIKVKPVSPFMAALRTIGSTIFVKYLCVKNLVRTWWKDLWHLHQGSNKPAEKPVQQ